MGNVGNFNLKKAGSACTAYDICISSSFFNKVNENNSFMGFLISIAIEGLENKYSLKLDRSMTI